MAQTALLSLTASLLLATVLSHSPIYQTNQEECPIAKNEISYLHQGRTFMLGNLSVYESPLGNPPADRLLIAVHDIFGDTNNTRLFSDMLAASYGFRVVTPDFYRGVPWDDTKWPPDPEEYAEWANTVANYDTVTQYDLMALLAHYKAENNITQFGIYGFCWGGKVSALAGGQFPEITVAGLVHPSSITTEMFEQTHAPMYLFPCMDDPDMLPYYEILKGKFGENSGHRRYNDMCHGFATSMGNFSDPLNFQRVEQTIDILGNFFQRNLP